LVAFSDPLAMFAPGKEKAVLTLTQIRIWKILKDYGKKKLKMVGPAAVCRACPSMVCLILSERSLLCNRLHTANEEKKRPWGDPVPGGRRRKKLTTWFPCITRSPWGIK